MSARTFKYFSGTQEVKDIHAMRNAAFVAKFGAINAKRQDGYSMLVAHPVSGPDAILPVTRVIDYKANPSLHKCDARCTHAKGRQCECSCGGANHGAES